MQEIEQKFLESGGEWEKEILSSLFTIKTSKSVDKGKLQLKNTETDYQFIGRTIVNNGVQGYVDKLDFEPNPENTFSVIQIGENMMQFRNKKWYASQNLFLLTPKREEIVRNKLFFISSVNTALKKFNGGYSTYPTLESLSNLEIYLPKVKNKYAFSFMENFIAELKALRVAELHAYLQATGLSDYTLTEEERLAISLLNDDKVEFRQFNVVDVFNVKNTFSILSRDIVENSGVIPYLSASRENNAVSSYISYDDKFLDIGNCIFIGGKTFVITYQEQNFYSNDSHNLCLYLKDKSRKSKFNQFFMISCLEKSLSYQYSWGNSISNKKIQNDQCLLPVKNNQIDFDYMETFISAIQKLVIKEVVNWADSEIAATESVI